MSANTSEYVGKQSMLTTIDNPYNPFDDFVKWYIYDETVLQYHTCGLLAKHCNTSIDASDMEVHKDIENAISEIVLNDPSHLYIRVFSEE